MTDAQHNDRPNVIFLLVDDMGWMDLACQGSRFYQTPNIDRLARQSLRFDNAYAAAPVCSPTRASILTGRYPAAVGITDYIPGQYHPFAPLLTPPNRWNLPEDEPSLATLLKQAGYATGHVGKWHLGLGRGHSRRFGFDDIVEEAPSHNDKMTSGLTDAAIRFIEKNRSRPFFLYFAHYAVHLRIEAQPHLIAKYQTLADPGNPQHNPAYAAMIEHLDTSVGRLLDRLDELQLTDNTLLVFFSDNGGLLEHDGECVTSNRPLRGGKGMLYEGGIREPLFIRYPSMTAPGVSHETITSVDFLPTILEATGTSCRGTKPLHGTSLMPLLRGNGHLPERSLYWHYPHYHLEKPSGAIRRGRYKLIEWFEDARQELFDLEEDLEEQHDLSAEQPQWAQSLHEDLEAWRRAIGASMPRPNPFHIPGRAGEQHAVPGWLPTKNKALAAGATEQGT